VCFQPVRWPAINTAVDSRKEVRGLPVFGSKKIRHRDGPARFDPIAAIGAKRFNRR
jgi:hypothetical protein